MPKKTDTSKIERIREAAVEIVSEKGIPNSSVASIARRAGVSVGYLYRHYPSKEELINDLLEERLNVITDKINTLIGKHDDLGEIVGEIVDFMVESAEANPAKHKFLIMLLNDFSTEIAARTKNKIYETGKTLIEAGNATRSLRAGITTDDLYLALVGIPMQYMAVRYKFRFPDSPTQRDELLRRIKNTSLCIIR